MNVTTGILDASGLFSGRWRKRASQSRETRRPFLSLIVAKPAKLLSNRGVS